MWYLLVPRRRSFGPANNDVVRFSGLKEAGKNIGSGIIIRAGESDRVAEVAMCGFR